ncbi:hypothetical protein ACA910_009780 [Epithemia clementina (nom. ined.)]
MVAQPVYKPNSNSRPNNNRCALGVFPLLMMVKEDEDVDNRDLSRPKKLSEGSNEQSHCGNPNAQTGEATVVRFAGVSEVWLSDDEQDDVDLSALWYSQEEFDQFKSLLVVDVKKLVKTSRRIRSRICKAHKATINCCLGTLNSVIDDGQRSPVQMKDLTVALHGCVEVVGLEQLVDRDLYREKRHRRIILLEAVDEMQATTYMLHEDIRSAILRFACENISGPSKLFAEYLGAAAAQAASAPTCSLPHLQQHDDRDVSWCSTSTCSSR